MIHIPGSIFFVVVTSACALAAAALLPARPSLNVARAKGRPETALRVLAPVGYKNLTIFPIKGPDAASGDYLTLDAGTKSGTVVIAERGAVQAAHRRPHNAANREVQQAVSYNSGASVNELALVNKSGKKLLLLAGEVIVGGQQDRIVQEDRIIPPISVPVALNVFCVEHGRWTPRATSYSGGGTGGGGGGGVANGVARERAPVLVSPERAPAAAPAPQVLEDESP